MKKILFIIALMISGLVLNAQSVGDRVSIEVITNRLDYPYYDSYYVMKYEVKSILPPECEIIEISGLDRDTRASIPDMVTISGMEFNVVSIAENVVGTNDKRYLIGITIPSGIKVIKPSAFKSTGLKSVTFEDDSKLISIGESAFSGCSITSINIPSGVTYIEKLVFYGCSSLTSINIPEDMVFIDNCAFLNCSSLKNINIPSSVTSIGERVFYGCSNLSSITFGIDSKLTSIGEAAFYGCSSLTSIYIPSGVTSLKTYNYSSSTYHGTFGGCSSLTDIVFEDNSKLTSIGHSTFVGCVSLKKIDIPSSVTSIGEAAFYGCSSLTSIYIPSGVTSLKTYNYSSSTYHGTFGGCSSLTDIIFEDNSKLASIGHSTFVGCNSLRNIDIPSSVTSIGEKAFYECFNLSSITFGDNSRLSSIGSQAFQDCSGLINIDIPSSVTSIGSRAFYNCTKLTSVVIGNNSRLTTIKDMAFSMCSNLKKITFGDNSRLSSIGSQAFQDCSGLINIDIPSSVTSIGSQAFYRCKKLRSMRCWAESVPTATGTDDYVISGQSDMHIQVPEPSVSLYKGKSPWKKYIITKIYPFHYGESIVVDYGNYSLKYFANPEVGGCVVSCESKPVSPTVITIPPVVTIDGIEIPVTCIKDNFLYNCTNVVGIEIPHSITSIGSNAFASCTNLTDIHIPNSVNSIGNDVFSACLKLSCVTFDKDIRLSSIGNYAFSSCVKLASIDIPKSVESIGSNAFSACSAMTKIYCYAETLPIMGSNVFLNCPSEMVVYVPDTSFNAYSTTTPWNDFKIVSMRPSLTTIAKSKHSIELEWNECGATTYEIYRNDTHIQTITETNYIDNDLEIYTEYCYKIKAIKNMYSYMSDEICTKTFDLPITVPNNLVAESLSTSEIKLTWDIVENALSYNIYQENDFIANVSETNYIVNNLNYYTDYCFTVTSVRNESVSPKSLEACDKTYDLVVTIPKNIKANALSTSSIVITWDGVENALSYNVYQGDIIIANTTETNYIDNNLDYYTDYCYTVTAVRNETETENSDEICTKTLDLPISIPENVVANTISTSSVIVTWNVVENALSYNVYCNDEFVTNVNATNYTANDLEYYTEYCFNVTAVRNETQSDKSETICIKTFDLPIAVPNNLVAEPLSTSEIKLTWDTVENALSYNIYQENDFIDNIMGTDYIVNNLDYSTDYCFTVTSVRNESESQKSGDACAKTFNLEVLAPTNIVANTVSVSSIIVTWDIAKNALSYNVYCNDELLANIKESNYTYNNLEPYTEYCFAISSVHHEIESAKTDLICARTFDLPITTPTNLSAESLSSSEIKLSWNAVENALSYNVYQGNNLIANTDELNFIVKDLDYDTEYCYTVTGVRNETESAKSGLACAKTHDLSIVIPKNVSAEAISPSSITLTWDVVENALGYNVYKGNDLIANVTGLNYTVKDLDYDTEYCFVVTAVRNEKESEKSELACVKTFDITIDAPINLKANAISTSSVILTWDVVENALSYNVYRNGKFVKNVRGTNYTDDDLEYNTEYCYTVTSTRSETESTKSDKACVKTLGENTIELSSSSLNIFPNPVKDEIIISSEKMIEEVSVFDVYGSLQVTEAPSLQDIVIIDMSNLNSGVYLVKVKYSGNGVMEYGCNEVIKRIIKY